MKLLKVINLAHLLGAIWLFNLGAFIGFSFITRNQPAGYSQSQGLFIILTVITGVIAFLGALLLYSTHILFLRKKSVVGHSRRSSVLFFLPLMGLLVAVFLFGTLGAYRLGTANNAVEMSKSEEVAPTTVPTESVRYINSQPINAVPSPTPAQQNPQTNQSNLAPCTVYGQTFNLTPENCRYYQGQEAGAKNVKNDGYVPPYQNYETNSTPVPTTPPEKYQSTQEACRRSCYDTYKNYPDTSLAKQQCVNSCQ